MPVGEVYAASWQSSGAQYPLTRDLPARHSLALNQLCTQHSMQSHPQTSFSRIINLISSKSCSGVGVLQPLELELEH